jgi:hypothetical protein
VEEDVRQNYQDVQYGVENNEVPYAQGYTSTIDLVCPETPNDFAGRQSKSIKRVGAILSMEIDCIIVRARIERRKNRPNRLPGLFEWLRILRYIHLWCRGVGVTFNGVRCPLPRFRVNGIYSAIL